jgi:sodium/bile acid cotransporter 7
MTDAAPPATSAQGLPRNEAEIEAAAAALGMEIPQACMPGVVANLALLDSHAERLLGQSDSRCA